MNWLAAFICLAGTYDYTDEIAADAGGHYCAEIDEWGAGTVINVESASSPPPITFYQVMGWDSDPWMTFYVVTVKNRTDADPGAMCGNESRYWVACFDRWFEYEKTATAKCLHDCVTLRLYDDV